MHFNPSKLSLTAFAISSKILSAHWEFNFKMKSMCCSYKVNFDYFVKIMADDKSLKSLMILNWSNSQDIIERSIYEMIGF